jgi:hypothetical protein
MCSGLNPFSTVMTFYFEISLNLSTFKHSKNKINAPELVAMTVLRKNATKLR